MSFIYCITNDINDKQYVGKTDHTIEKRFKEHCQDSKRERMEKRPLYNAMNKYGIEHFHIEQLEECSYEESEDREIYWIKKLNTFNDGYNATLGGDSKHYLDYDKILYIHDWITENIEYDETLNKTNRNDIYGAFIEKEVTCGGYAKAFKYLADKLNIDCIIIQGKATSDEKTENHAWNYIKLSNNWYGVDCTWDDPIIIGGNENEKQQKYYTYFLKGKEAFNNHKPFETFWDTKIKINYPELSNNNYN